MTLINGKAQSTVSAKDRGLQFGDGLFETMAVVDGELMHWNRHWQRLLNGCERLFLPVPDEALLLKEIRSLVNDDQRQVIKLVYTRGNSERGYKFGQSNATRIISRSDWPVYNTENTTVGIVLKRCQTPIALQPILAGLKHLNRLENVLARHEWDDVNIAEGLMCDLAGRVIEGTMSNVFLVHNQRLLTPDLSRCGVAGITRERVIQFAEQENIDIKICDIYQDELYAADEIFICNSLIGIWPVKQIDEQFFKTNGQIESMTQHIQKKLIFAL